MSDTRCRVQGAGSRLPGVLTGVGLALVLLGSAGPAQGQSLGPLEERVRRLEQRAAALNAKADSVMAAERARWADSLEAITDGGFRILAPPELAGTAREAARLAATTLARAFGDSVVLVIRQEHFLVFPDAVLDSAHSELRHVRGLGTPVLAPADDRVTQLAMNLIGQVHQVLWQRFDPALREWLAAPLAPTLEPARFPGNSYIDLVTSASPPAGACFGGSMAGCLHALGLERPADPGMAWYSASGRRELVGRMSQVLRTGASTHQFASCVHGHSDQDCQALLRRAAPLIPPPLNPQTRSTLLRLALARGGPEALSRLFHSPGDPIARRLADVAGQDPAVLLREWHRHILAAKPPPTTLTLPQAWTTIMWAGLLVLVALRSSRWR
jgi:hypothetical protein